MTTETKQSATNDDIEQILRQDILGINNVTNPIEQRAIAVNTLCAFLHSTRYTTAEFAVSSATFEE